MDGQSSRDYMLNQAIDALVEVTPLRATFRFAGVVHPGPEYAASQGTLSASTGGGPPG